MLVANSALSPAARLSTRPASIGPMASSKASAHTSAIVACTNHGRSVGAGTGRGLAANARRASAIPTSAGSLVADCAHRRRGEHLARGLRLVGAAAQRLQARVERRRRAHVEHARHQGQRLEQLGRLLVGRAQPRRRAVDDRHRVLDPLGAPERVREDERRAERHAVVVARDVECLAQMVLARRLPGRRLRDPELEQQPGALGRGRRLGQRAAQEHRRGLGRAAARRGTGGVDQAPRDRDVAGGLGGQQVLGRALLAGRVVVHELGRTPVGQRALGHPELLVHPGPHERVDEGQRTLGLEDAGRHEGVRGLGGLRGVELGQRGRARQLRALEHGHGAGQARRRRRQATQAQLDPAPRGAGAHPLHARGGARVGRHALAAHGLDQLAHEERDAAGGAVARGGEGLVGCRGQPHLDEPAHRGDAQRRGLHHVGVRVGGERRQQVRLLDVRLGPRGDEQRDPQLLQARHEEGEEAQRGRVGPVRVVDAEHDELTRGQVRAQPVEAVQDREGRVGRRGRRLALLQRAREPEHTGGQLRGPLQQVGALGGARLVQQRLEELAHHAEGEVALELRAARAQEARRSVLAGDPGGREDGRLADACRPFDHHAAPRSLARRGDRGIDAAQLPLALEEQVDSGRRRGAHGVERTAGTERRRSRTFQP